MTDYQAIRGGGATLGTPRKKTETHELGPDTWPRKGTFLGVTQQDFVRVRVREYSRRRWGYNVTKVKDVKRLAVVAILQEYGFTIEDMMKVLGRGRSTIYRDISDLEVYQKCNKEYAREFEKLRNFVKYYNLEG